MRVAFRLLIGLAVFLSALTAAAEMLTEVKGLDATHLPAGAVSLIDGWRVQMGDDPAFASQIFDDSKWQITTLDADSQNIAPGMRWYRIRVKLPPTHQPMALLLIGPAGHFEVYANGAKILEKDIDSLWHVYRDHESVVQLGDVASEVQLADSYALRPRCSCMRMASRSEARSSDHRPPSKPNEACLSRRESHSITPQPQLIWVRCSLASER